MSKTLSVLIVENFVINEGPKLDKFKRGAKKVGTGIVTTAVLGSMVLGGGGLAKKYDANRNYDTDMAKSQYAYTERFNSLKDNHKVAISNIDNIEGMKLDSKKRAKDVIYKNYDQDMADNLTDKTNKQVEATYRKDNQHKEGNQDLARAGGLAGIGAVGAVALAAGSKDDKKKQEKKSLKERLNLVKSGMYLNEESDNITALRNKIRQGLIILPGLKGSAADKMEDSIRGWEDQINELEKK